VRDLDRPSEGRQPDPPGYKGTAPSFAEAGTETFPAQGFSFFSLSFQSPFQLPSRYLFTIDLAGYIQPSMEHTTELALYSQTTRLDHSLHGPQSSKATGLSPSMIDLSRSLRLHSPREKAMDSLHCEPEFDPTSFSVGYSGFARRYSRNLG